jgi:hypothetical protein
MEYSGGTLGPTPMICVGRTVEINSEDMQYDVLAHLPHHFMAWSKRYLSDLFSNYKTQHLL